MRPVLRILLSQRVCSSVLQYWLASEWIRSSEAVYYSIIMCNVCVCVCPQPTSLQLVQLVNILVGQHNLIERFAVKFGEHFADKWKKVLFTYWEQVYIFDLIIVTLRL